jgi:Domain of unknown function (DUF4159)
MKRAAVLLLLGIGLTIAYAQRRERDRYRQAVAPASEEELTWTVDSRFKHDVFTFARIRYDSVDMGWRRGGGGWATDRPDSDLNFSWRLQQVTALKVEPQPVDLELTDPELFDYPWIYMVEPGSLLFHEDEVAILRKYLLNGGFLMVDDFWGEEEWENFREQMKRVFPERDPVEVRIEHPIFHCVFPIEEKPQVPNIYTGARSEYTGITWERPDAQVPHYRAIFDDKGRIMVFICHNTDNGDGWEREGESAYYFREFSEKKAYPLGINIVFYSMTH